ncbi:unnamed protein product [Arabidopsis halleri]
MENLKGSYGSDVIDDYGSKLCLQNQLLSKILNEKDMKIDHLGAIKERLLDQKVLIVLDDVDDLEQLDVLAKEPSWFGLGSRIFVTTEDRQILNAHWVNYIYHVGYPSEEEALEILCLSAFQKNSPLVGFEELAKKITNFCGSLPLGLRVVGSSLRRESRHEWERQLSKLETSLDRKIENVLRVGYCKLSKKDQSLFLHIAFFFNNETVDHVTTMLADSNLDISNGMKTLADKSLVHISTIGWIQMHRLLQQLGRQLVHEQSDDPGKRQFLVEAEEIRDVLANETGTGSVIGISFDMSKISEFSITGRAFEGMRNLRVVLDREGIFSSFSGFKACLVLPPTKKYALLVITCRIRSKAGVIITELKWNSVNYFQYQTTHLFICGGKLVQETPKVDVTASKIMFEFSCRDNHKILECGVRILSEEEESSSGNKVGNFETGGSSDHYTDGEEGYEPKALQVSQYENINNTSCWSWFKKLWSGEEDDDKEEAEKTSIMIRR